MVNIILADQQQLVRSGLKTLLLGTSADRHITEADKLEQALTFLPHSKTDFLITEMLAGDNPALIGKALALDPALKVLVLSDEANLSLVHQVFVNGASGFLLKECLYDELLLAMKCAGVGRQYLCSGISSTLLATARLWMDKKDPAASNLIFTDREKEVLALIGEGKTNMEMSEELFLSKRTVEGHRQSLLDKTNSRNTAQLVRFAVRHGILY